MDGMYHMGQQHSSNRASILKGRNIGDEVLVGGGSGCLHGIKIECHTDKTVPVTGLGGPTAVGSGFCDLDLQILAK